MTLTPEKQIEDIEQMLDKIEDIIVSGDLPKGLAGDLMSKSHMDRYERLQDRLAKLQDLLVNGSPK
ncbi:hypothetical protein LVO79_20990 (plasmid) [Roseivivax marinus]|uniref:hypothetical protein n=1 Tax=Roseivivax marinus TaxID=1379903 RepID=UPI001F04910E|nr:hypothetical protein [Roseivivax marinus]UMA67259.1 hypothetical protein LVO79_20990 [Roseivivax marinus]